MTIQAHLQQLLQGRTSHTEQRQILELLRSATADDLNSILSQTDSAALLGQLTNHWWGPANRTAARHLLTERLPEVGLEARANLAYGLQAGYTSAADAQAILAIFHSALGEDLTHLKNAMNMRTDSHDLEGLVFGDIRGRRLRASILEHIATQAVGIHPGEAKILCDIDDTVVASLHEHRFPRGSIYPGVLAFLDALDHGPGAQPFSLGDLTFVTARPSDAFGIIENHTRASLRRAGVADHSVLTGSVLNLLTHDLMAGRKLRNIEHYHALFPEYPLVFIGDSGQGDIQVGELMWERFPGAISLIVIHDVVGLPRAERERLGRRGIQVVDTYIGAAGVARDRGLLTGAQHQHVVEESCAHLDTIRWETQPQETDARALIARDADGNP
ncbi:MAG: phosphatase domain-containing protein [Propioniciclava sp.]